MKTSRKSTWNGKRCRALPSIRLKVQVLGFHFYYTQDLTPGHGYSLAEDAMDNSIDVCLGDARVTIMHYSNVSSGQS